MSESANAEYLLRAFHRLAPGGIGLDYGCGAGRLVGLALEAGGDFWGAEAYYGDPERWAEDVGGTTPQNVRDRIRLLTPDFRLPFDDASFDFVCSDQVIEHVDDLNLTVSEIARVTKPGGWNVHIFPTIERMFEAHLRTPLYHRVPARFRRAYAKPFHRLGIASYASQLPAYGEWFAQRESFFVNHVRLRRVATVRAAFERFFAVEHAEIDKLNSQRGWSLPDSGLLRLLEHRRSGVTLRMQRR